MINTNPEYRTVYGRIRREPFVFWFGDKQIDADEVRGRAPYELARWLEPLLPLSAIEVVGLYKLFELDADGNWRTETVKTLITEAADHSNSKPIITSISCEGGILTIKSCEGHPFPLD